MGMRDILMIFLVVSLVFVVPIDVAFAASGNGNFGVHTVKSQDAMCGGNSGTNIKDSLLLSIVTLCLPGILEKIYDWNQIKCQEVQCMYEAVKNNLDPSFCSKTRAYQVCTTVIGEIFAIPPMAILEYYRKIIAQLLANPIGVAYAVTVTAARTHMDTCIAEGGCSAPIVFPSAVLLTVNDISALIQRFKDMLENGFFPPGVKDQPNYCDGIGDIVKEMETIVQNS